MNTTSKTKKKYTFSLTPGIFERVKETAWDDRRRFSEQVECIFRDYLERRAKEKTNEN